MDHFKHIYQQEAENYHEMIAVEDVDSNLLTTLNKITDFTRKRVLDLGSGTGRLPLLINRMTNQITGIDLHYAMLVEQRKRQFKNSFNAELAQSDMRYLPFGNQQFDVLTAGWALGHFTGWYGSQWQHEAQKVLQEMERVCISPGVIIILETMTTGSTTPAPPNAGLAAYYHWLEQHLGFQSKVISTDYQFKSLEDAIFYSDFFFGADLAEKVKRNNWVRLPEWTGIWWKIM